MTDPPRYPGTPRWVKVLVFLTIGLFVLVVILLLTGGPGRHRPGPHGLGWNGDATPSSCVVGHGLDGARTATVTARCG